MRALDFGCSQWVGRVVIDVETAVVLEHPFGILQELSVLPQVGHYLVHVVSLGGHWQLLLVQLVLYIWAGVLGPNLVIISFFTMSSSASPRRNCMKLGLAAPVLGGVSMLFELSITIYTSLLQIILTCYFQLILILILSKINQLLHPWLPTSLS